MANIEFNDCTVSDPLIMVAQDVLARYLELVGTSVKYLFDDDGKCPFCASVLRNRTPSSKLRHLRRESYLEYHVAAYIKVIGEVDVSPLIPSCESDIERPIAQDNASCEDRRA